MYQLDWMTLFGHILDCVRGCFASFFNRIRCFVCIAFFAATCEEASTSKCKDREEEKSHFFEFHIDMIFWVYWRFLPVVG